MNHIKPTLNLPFLRTGIPWSPAKHQAMSKGHLQRKGVVRQIRWERELLSMVDSLLGQVVDGGEPVLKMEGFPIGKP